MEFKQIKKIPGSWSVPPNLANYQQTYSGFSWEQILKELDGLPNGAGINIAYEAVDRHALSPLRNHVALRWLSRHGETRDFTYAELRAGTNRFANLDHGAAARTRTDRYARTPTRTGSHC